MSVLLVAFVLLILTLIGFKFSRRPRNLPPGPPALPFIGNALSMGSKPSLAMRKWRKQYGDTFSCYLGPKLLVVMNNYETARKAFGDEATAGRDKDFFLAKLLGGQGLVMSESNLWKTHRRFALTTLRDFGMGKSWLEDAIIAEVDDLCDILENYKSTPMDPKVILSHSVANVICALVFGKRFLHSDHEFRRLTQLMNKNIELTSFAMVFQVFPFLKYVPGRYKDGYDTVLANLDELKGFLKQLIAQHNKEFKSEDVKDYIDAYLQEDRNLRQQNNSENTFDESQLIFSLLDLFAAGTETTSTSTIWGFLFMLENPEVMRKVQTEIDANIKPDEAIRISDKVLLPYTEATVWEIQRVASLVPMGVIHEVVEDVQIDGYTVPKGSLLAAHQEFIHHDPRYWKNPDTFDPTRFLDAEGKVTRPDGFMPFSIGKRACLGESLAKMELYLFFSNLLRRFDLQLPPGETVSHEKYVPSIVKIPLPFNMIFKPRTQALQN